MLRAALAASLALAAAGCGGDELETASVALEGATGTTTVEAEVADSESERRLGLKGREELAPDAGMIFLFGKPVTTQFVMEDTLIPLSIAFAVESGRIVTIRDMDPCREQPCPIYASEEPFTVALEVAQGSFERWGIQVGDRLRIGPDPG